MGTDDLKNPSSGMRMAGEESTDAGSPIRTKEVQKVPFRENDLTTPFGSLDVIRRSLSLHYQVFRATGVVSVSCAIGITVVTHYLIVNLPDNSGGSYSYVRALMFLASIGSILLAVAGGIAIVLSFILRTSQSSVRS